MLAALDDMRFEGRVTADELSRLRAAKFRHEAKFFPDRHERWRSRLAKVMANATARCGECGVRFSDSGGCEAWQRGASVASLTPPGCSGCWSAAEALCRLR